MKQSSGVHRIRCFSDQLVVSFEGSSGFFGIGSKPAIIKARKINTVSEEDEIQEIVDTVKVDAIKEEQNRKPAKPFVKAEKPAPKSEPVKEKAPVKEAKEPKPFKEPKEKQPRQPKEKPFKERPVKEKPAKEKMPKEPRKREARSSQTCLRSHLRSGRDQRSGRGNCFSFATYLHL